MLYKAFRRRLRKPCLITGMSDEALNAVSGGIGVTAVCDKCVSAAEFPGEGACFGAWSNRKTYTCGSLMDTGSFLKCRKCGYKKNN